jgi:hypothetical protein
MVRLHLKREAIILDGFLVDPPRFGGFFKRIEIFALNAYLYQRIQDPIFEDHKREMP